MILSQLRLEWTCVGILRGPNWGLFWYVYCVWIIPIWLCEIFWGVLLPCCERHFCLNYLYFGQDFLDWHDKLLYWDYEIVIQIVSKWQIKPVMNGEIHVYWDFVCIELWVMNCAITQMEDPLGATSFYRMSIMMGSTVGTWRV